jgi:hypothetical protein
MFKKLSLVLACLLVFAVRPVMAQVDFCEGNFDYDKDQDGTDAFTFKSDFGRSALKNPCPVDGPVHMGKTGSTLCYDTEWNPTDCTGTGADGEYQKGITWPSPRFTDNGNFTITDNLTGLIWLKLADCFGTRTWNQALADANGLANGACGLSDGSSAGDWRLPNVQEMLSLINYGSSAPAIPAGHPFTTVRYDAPYWTSTVLYDWPDYIWYVNMNYGDHYQGYTESTYYVWPVRGGR